jgi:citrate lyase subunit beta / citryl-CoA lyase
LSALLRRSQLFVPGNEERKIRKSLTLGADSIIFDLEDAVPESGKAAAREFLKEILQKLDFDHRKTEVCVRVNKKSNGEYSPEDLVTVQGMKNVDSIVLPKIEFDAGKIHEITGKNLILLVETAKGLYNLHEIARSKGSVAIAFGPQDYANSARGNVAAYISNPSILGELVAASRANDLDPIDGVFFELTNLLSFRKVAEAARDLGCSGKQVVHPSQIEIANTVFSPSEAELKEAAEIVSLYEEAEKSNTGALRVNDQLVDAVHYRRAKDILARMSG